MNNQNKKGGIEWTDFTWSPITGCLHNCSYCYAKKIAMRFDGHFKPTFHIKRLNDKMPKKPSKIFICSMADLFGDWVKKEWIEKVLIVAEKNPQHTFQFLTKNPKRYLEFIFPKNCWLGTTIEKPEYADRMKPFLQIKNYKFVSIEPLLGDFTGVNFDLFDLVIIGADSNKGAVKPKKEWIKSIQHHNIFFKNNLYIEERIQRSEIIK